MLHLVTFITSLPLATLLSNHPNPVTLLILCTLQDSKKKSKDKDKKKKLKKAKKEKLAPGEQGTANFLSRPIYVFQKQMETETEAV
jgi:hypothetical protein